MGIQISGNKVYANGKQMQVYDVQAALFTRVMRLLLYNEAFI